MADEMIDLTPPEFGRVLKSFHRVLKNKAVTRDVQVSFRVNGRDECWVWRCRTKASGKVTCGWEPC